MGGNTKLSKDGIADEYFPNLVDPGIKEIKSEFRYYISGDNEQMHVIHMLICLIYSQKIESGILVSGM